MLLFIKEEAAKEAKAKAFQYISCYSLSPPAPADSADGFSFNTSHVTLYLKQWQEKTLQLLCFNTSHVTLYR